MRSQSNTGLIQGFATTSGTKNYFEENSLSFVEYNPLSWFRFLPRLALYVSRLGFGTYRVTQGNAAHYNAMRDALLSGTNVIDTAPNYSDGAAEILTGQVLRDLIQANRIARNQIVITTKVGYIEGAALDGILRKNPYKHMQRLSHEVAYSLDPLWIRDQLQLSLSRLSLSTVDFVLLANPEILFKETTLTRTQASQIIDNALSCLEELRQEGLLRAYGISSNTAAWPADDAAALPMDAILKNAPDHFHALQFPANLAETDFRFSRRSHGGNLCTLAREHEIWTTSNRPFHALWQNRIERLTTLPEEPPDEGAAVVAEINRLVQELEATEERLLALYADSHFRFDERTPAFSGILMERLGQFDSKEALKSAQKPILRQIYKTVKKLKLLERDSVARYANENYVRLCNAALSLWDDYAGIRQHVKLKSLSNRLARASSVMEGQPLTVQTMLFLMAAECPVTVLAGMRSVSYSSQLHRLYSMSPLPEKDAYAVARVSSEWLDENLPS